MGPSGGRWKSGYERGDDASDGGPSPGKRTRAKVGGIQRKPAHGGAMDAAEAQADAAGASVAAGAPAGDARIVPNDTVPASGQFRRSAFLDQVRAPAVIQTATEGLGWAGAAVGCPYIERWFEKHRDIDAAALEHQVARRYAELGQAPATAAGYIAPKEVQRLTASIEAWYAGRDISAQLAAAGLVEPGRRRRPPSPGAIPGGAVQRTRRASRAAAGRRRSSADPRRARPGRADGGGTQARMGSAFGTSFSDVRIHADDKGGAGGPRGGAHAFTLGSHVAFAPGRYQPGTPAGDALLAHELTHVLQQRGAAPAPPRHKSDHLRSGVDAAEHDADQGAYGALRYLYNGFMSGVSRARERQLGGRAPPLLDRRTDLDAGHPANSGSRRQRSMATASMSTSTPRRVRPRRPCRSSLKSATRGPTTRAWAR